MTGAAHTNGLKLDLACGVRKREGFIGVDFSPEVGADVVLDLRQMPWPWADGSVDEVYCAHFFEHLTGAERMRFMDELYRVMHVGAKATLITPHGRSDGAAQDPTHQWPPVLEASYHYFNRAQREQMFVGHYPIVCDFDVQLGVRYEPYWASRPDAERQTALQRFNNVAYELVAQLTKR
jgi:hypothetical protein